MTWVFNFASHECERNFLFLITFHFFFVLQTENKLSRIMDKNLLLISLKHLKTQNSFNSFFRLSKLHFDIWKVQMHGKRLVCVSLVMSDFFQKLSSFLGGNLPQFVSDFLYPWKCHTLFPRHFFHFRHTRALLCDHR